ncbi:MAG: 3-deoxy-7-phosphoheptulonate synthase [Gammaproteobacteria bacterium]|nr:MAG: 3-deoxy-7-phosphoheptulonate synthase [Gammaproteobacteria bacterium]
MKRIDDVRINTEEILITPNQLHKNVPHTKTAMETVYYTRQAISHVLNLKDDRLVVIVGPCSIHNPLSALEYAKKLKVYKEQLSEDLIIVMRVYFEKPRTTVGWKGLINDPFLNGSYHVNTGLKMAHKLLLDINNLGVGAGTEYLDLISPQYIADLISWGAIGARTTESQAHRELASGLSCPVGFKNATNGDVQVATDAIISASRPHFFMSVTKDGYSAVFSTTGNLDCHIILRGGKQPNYDAASIDDASHILSKTNLESAIMVDCSHANSRKNIKRQIDVATDLAKQISRGDNRITGIMLESHIKEGQQKTEPNKKPDPDISITDACIGWEDTTKILIKLSEAVQSRRKKNLNGQK